MSFPDQLQRTLGASYTFERELGGGGMSRVYLARETALGRTVVVKVIAPELAESMSTERFQRRTNWRRHPGGALVRGPGDNNAAGTTVSLASRRHQRRPR